MYYHGFETACHYQIYHMLAYTQQSAMQAVAHRCVVVLQSMAEVFIIVELDFAAIAALALLQHAQHTMFSRSMVF